MPPWSTRSWQRMTIPSYRAESDLRCYGRRTMLGPRFVTLASWPHTSVTSLVGVRRL
jgi:hypothetical protein